MESQSRPTPWKCQVVKVKTSPSLLIYLVCSNTKCDSFKANFTECKSKCLWLPQYVNKFLVWHNKFGPAQNILGPLKGQGISTYLFTVFWIFRYDVVIDYFLRRYLNRLSESNEDMKQALFEQGWNVDPNVQIDQDLIISLYGKYSSFNGISFQ